MMRQLLKDSRGGVHILGAFSLVAVIGAMGFGVDATAAYSAKIRNQRVSDMAALTAAQVMNDTGSVTTAEAAALATARAAGLIDPVVEASTGDAPTGEGQAVSVTVTTNEGIYFARILGAGPSVAVAASSMASFGRIVPPCIVALAEDATDGIIASGGTRMTATDCAVASNSRISATGGAQLSAKLFSTPAGTRVSGGAAITTTPAANQFNSGLAEDPLSGDAELGDAFELLKPENHPAPPTLPAGTDLSPPWWPNTYQHSGYTATWDPGTSTFTFPPGNYQIKNLNVPGGMKVVFAGPNTSVKVSGSVSVGGGSALTIGDGYVAFKNGISVSGGTPVRIGNGEHYMGPVTVGGSSTLSIGNGPLHINGNVQTAGGSNFSVGATGNHFINGNVALSGSSNFGAGRYVVTGSISNNTGGVMQGTDVTFISGGRVYLGGDAKSILSAPMQDGDDIIPGLLFASKSNQDTVIGAGAGAAYKGAFYVPNSKVSFSGGATIDGGGDCFMLIAARVDLSGGAVGATACPSLGSQEGGVRVALIR